MQEHGSLADSDSSSNTIGERVSGAVVEPVKVDELDFGAAGSDAFEVGCEATSGK